jgi:ketosteroid isomerase-like protein
MIFFDFHRVGGIAFMREHHCIRRSLLVLVVSLCVSMLTGMALGNSPSGSDAEAKLTIRKALEQWPRDFNDKKAAAVCGLFASDLIATYPGAPDRNYDAMCAHLTHVLHDPQKTFGYDPPQIEEMLVSGDMSVVRLTWTLHVKPGNGSRESTIIERGMDVLHRQPDGSWKIRISYAYPMEPAHAGE